MKQLNATYTSMEFFGDVGAYLSLQLLCWILFMKFNIYKVVAKIHFGKDKKIVELNAYSSSDMTL